MNEPAAPNGGFERLLEHLRQNRGFDFTGYKRPSLMRRVTKRMQSVNLETFSEYLDYLEVHPEEFTALFNTILINVTGFFRDEESWKYLAESVLPQIINRRKEDAPVRIWSAGCASGEEPYSIAMLLAEALGKEGLHSKVKIYATDADEEALTAARQAVYSEKDVQAVPRSLREKYLEQIDGRYAVNTDLRRAVIFGRHDVVQDAPMSHLDLLVCRNTLMYFNAETQARILRRFTYAINPGGFLFLGKAEMLLDSPFFTPVEIKHRIFIKSAHANPRERAPLFGQTSGSDFADPGRYAQLRDAVFDGGQTGQIAVDGNGNLIMANQQARQLYGIEPGDVGRPFHDLEISYRPADLRSLIDQVYLERKSLTLANVEKRLKDGNTRAVDIHVFPLVENGAVIGVGITFNDATRYHKLEQDLQRARVDFETASEELQAANEELQSTNEELETMNEEMQSTNEELQTINDELRQRTDELNRSNTFLQSVLASLRGGVIVVGPKLNIVVWNPGAENLWGLLSDEAKGHSLFSLDIGLPVGKLRSPIQTSMAERAEQELIVDAVNRRGRKIKCRMVVNPLNGANGEPQGAIILTEEMGM